MATVLDITGLELKRKAWSDNVDFRAYLKHIAYFKVYMLVL